MLVLLDEMVPRRLKSLLPPGVEGKTVQEVGWGSLDNGELLRAAQQEFDVLLTTDRGIPHQRNPSRYEIVVLVLAGKTNRLDDLEPLMPEANRLLQEVNERKLLRGAWRVGEEGREKV